MKISIKERVIKLIGYLALFPAFLLMMHLLDFSWPLPSHTYAEVHREKEKLEKLLKSTKAALEEEKQARKQAELKRNDAEDKRREIQGQLEKIWNACNYNHNGQEILDMTTDAWCGLSVAEQQKYATQYQEGYAKAKGLEVEKTIAKSGASFAFRLIPPGRFWMEDKHHRVVISQPFYLGKTEVTQGQWQSVMGSNPSTFKNAGSNAPVENVSWDDCQGFFQRTGLQFPTEAQWEYACRSGVTRAYYWGDEMDGAYAWHGENSGGKTQAVAQKKPNAWGLFDMSGNVWEWCSDGYGDYPFGDTIDPTGPQISSARVNRGGGLYSGASLCRCACRYGYSPDSRRDYLGFRCALAPQKK